MERSVIEPNRTPIVRLGSIIEHNRTHNKIWSIEHNRTFDYRTVVNRTQSNVRLPNGRQSYSIKRSITSTFFCLFHLIKVDYDLFLRVLLIFRREEMDSEQNRIGLSSIAFEFVRLVR